MGRLIQLIAALVVCFSSFASAADPSALRVYVIVVDGLHPAEVGLATPTLAGLKAAGTWYERSLSVMIAETLPNHAAMMTGVLPQKNGIVANDTAGGRQQDPKLLLVPTLVTRLETECAAVNTATVQSKTYLFNLFQANAPATSGGGVEQRRADFHPDVQPKIPLSDHALDVLTMQAFLDWVVNTPPPQFAFVNLGDVDRSGHVDPTGNLGVPAVRQAAIVDTDTLLGVLVQLLKLQGAWESTVIIIVSDHSMDWSLPQNFVSLGAALTAANVGGFTLTQNGGAEIVTLANPANTAAAATAVLGVAGVDRVLTRGTNPSMADFGLDHERAGHVIAFAKPGWRFSDPSNTSNPIPGNHGHAITQRNVLLVSGGHPALAAANVVATNPLDTFQPPLGTYGSMSVTPTVATLFGLGEVAHDGPKLDAAFAGGSTPNIGACGP
ncbi:MAG: alkaline phosphatase family protein [Candidatus Binatia bacterium]